MLLTYGKQIYWCNANASKLKFTLRWCFWTRTVERSCGKGEIYDLNMSTRARFRCLSFFSLVLIALNSGLSTTGGLRRTRNEQQLLPLSFHPVLLRSLVHGKFELFTSYQCVPYVFKTTSRFQPYAE